MYRSGHIESVGICAVLGASSPYVPQGAQVTEIYFCFLVQVYIQKFKKGLGKRNCSSAPQIYHSILAPDY